MITPQFIHECISGSESAIQSMVRSNQRGVFQIALTVIDDGSAPIEEAVKQAEIATRDTFILALDQLYKYQEETPFTAWLYRYAITASRRRARRWRLERALLSALWGAGRIFSRAVSKTPGEAVEKDGFQAHIRGLSENLRLPLVLRYYHDFSPAEIARLLNIGEGAVHARLDAAREKITGSLVVENEDDDDDD
jgi:RNA polymerase sigma factor (sigma-70 family)